MDINHIAKLARIGLSEEESEKLGGELAAILDFVGKLKKAGTAKIEPITRPPLTSPRAMSGAAGGTALFNVVRDDELRPADLEGRNRILENVPKRKGDYIEIMPVFE